MRSSFWVGAACGASVTAALFLLWPSVERPAAPQVDARVDDGRAAAVSRAIRLAGASTEGARVLPAKEANKPPAAAPPAKTTAPTPPVVSTSPVPTIALSAEHARMLSLSSSEGRPATPPELHAQLATQPKDPEWSYDKEREIRQALAAANIAGDIDVMNVECRESLCEVLAFGNVPTSAEQWQKMWDQMASQPWHADMTQSASAFGSQNGRQTFAVFIARSKR